jgi:hypothetical protein
MVRDPASPACGQSYRKAPRLADARDHQRHLLCDEVGLPVAPAAKRFAAMEHGLSVVCDVPRFEKINHALVSPRSSINPAAAS